MNQETTNPSLTNDLSRCQQHRTRTGRRCRLAVSGSAARKLLMRRPERPTGRIDLPTPAA